MTRKLVKQGNAFLFSNTGAMQTIFKNTFWLLIAEFVNKGLMFFLIVLIARILGAQGYGQFAFAMSFTALFAVIADLGLSTLTIHEIAKNNKLVKKYIDNIVTIKLLLAILTFSLITLGTLFMGKSADVNNLIYLFGLYVIINSLSEFLRAIFRAFEKMEYEAYSKIIQGLLLFGFGLWFLIQGYGAVYIILGYIIGAVAGLVFTLILVWKNFSKFNLEWDFKFWKQILNKSWVFALSIIFVSIYVYIDIFILSFFVDNTLLGYYSVAFNFIIIFYLIPGIMSNVYFPRFSRLYIKDNSQLQKNIKYFFYKINVILILLVITLYLFSKKIVLFLYGIEYLSSVMIINILIIALIFKFYSYPFGTLLSSLNSQTKRIQVQVLSACVNVIINLALIPIYGLVGAAIATVISELFLLIGYIYFFRKINLNY